jgi:hypothetical protein
MLVSRRFEAAIAGPEFGGEWWRGANMGEFRHAYLADPNGYVVEIHYEGAGQQ